MCIYLYSICIPFSSLLHFQLPASNFQVPTLYISYFLLHTFYFILSTPYFLLHTFSVRLQRLLLEHKPSPLHTPFFISLLSRCISLLLPYLSLWPQSHLLCQPLRSEILRPSLNMMFGLELCGTAPRTARSSRTTASLLTSPLSLPLNFLQNLKARPVALNSISLQTPLLPSLAQPNLTSSPLSPLQLGMPLPGPQET